MTFSRSQFTWKWTESTGSDRFARNEDTDWTVTLDSTVEPSARVPLDLLFLLDATGSMSDEIDQIKSTLLSSRRASATCHLTLISGLEW